jgi:hypothetical protein
MVIDAPMHEWRTLVPDAPAEIKRVYILSRRRCDDACIFAAIPHAWPWG